MTAAWWSRLLQVTCATALAGSVALASGATGQTLLPAAASAPSASAPAAGPQAPDKPAAEKPANPALRWEKEVAAYEARDKESPPPAGAILFVGSSTIRMWRDLAADFQPLQVIGRGVGGCQISDMVYYVDRIVIPYRPSQIVFYAGDNDVASRKSAERVLEDFKAFVEKVRQALPEVKIHFIAIKPSPSRAKLWPEAQKANNLVRQYVAGKPGLGFIDTATVMLDAEGKPRPELFLPDMLHMNRKGYELWVPIIRSALEQAGAAAPSAGATKQ